MNPVLVPEPGSRRGAGAHPPPPSPASRYPPVGTLARTLPHTLTPLLPSPSGCVRDIIIMATRAAAWDRGARVIPGGGGRGGSTSGTTRPDDRARASVPLPLAGSV